MTRHGTSRPAGIAYVGAGLLALSALTSCVQLWGPVGLLVVALALGLGGLAVVRLSQRTIRIYAQRTAAAGHPVFAAAMGPSGGQLHLWPDRVEFTGRRRYSVSYPWEEVAEVSLVRKGSRGSIGLLLVSTGDGRRLELEVADRPRLADELRVLPLLRPEALHIKEPPGGAPP